MRVPNSTPPAQGTPQAASTASSSPSPHPPKQKTEIPYPDFLKPAIKRWKIVLPVTVLLIALIAYWGVSSSNAAKENEERVKALAQSGEVADAPTSAAAGVDTLLMSQQPDLIEKYGTPAEGFIWDVDGTLLSLGDKSVDSEEVVYRYLRALNTLDFTTVETFSRRSQVVEGYSSYFDKSTAKSSDDKDQYLRDVYRISLLSLQVDSVTRSANFSSNKQVFTIKGTILDLSDKSFWLKDKEQIFNNLNQSYTVEEDSKKVNATLFSYLTSKYQSSVDHLQTGVQEGDVPMRQVSFDVTVERFPAQDTGWVVTIDKDLDDLCSNRDGVFLPGFILENYKDSTQVG